MFKSSDSQTLLDIIKERDEAAKKKIKSVNKGLEESKSLVAGRLPVYAFADRPLNLPSFQIGIISDGLDIGETAGNGTGCIAMYKPSLNEWYRTDNTVVTV